jgi:hypothetical protein
VCDERKPWQLLISLLQRPGELVTRSELQRAVWSADVFVDFEHGLNVAVRKLRAALNDSVVNPKYIDSVASDGYRFIGSVEQRTFDRVVLVTMTAIRLSSRASRGAFNINKRFDDFLWGAMFKGKGTLPTVPLAKAERPLRKLLSVSMIRCR